MNETSKTSLPNNIIFYDGVCALCNGFVRFVLFADKSNDFFFAPLQGESAKQVAAQHPNFPKTLESIVFLRDGKLYLHSSAIFAIVERLPWPWRLCSIFDLLPRFFTDAVYRLIAKVRYRLVGRYDVCPLPAVEHRARFLN